MRNLLVKLLVVSCLMRYGSRGPPSSIQPSTLGIFCQPAVDRQFESEITCTNGPSAVGSWPALP
jgi:hypothetical protein